MGYRAALLPGARTSFLDHLIPLCHLMDMPLICTDPWIASIASSLYPPTEILLASESSLQEIEEIYSVEPCRLYPQGCSLGEFFLRSQVKTIAAFHGIPSKFRGSYWIERYTDEDVVLIQGAYLEEYMREKGVWERLRRAVVIGNLRAAFYQTNRIFFQNQVKAHVFPKNQRCTILYAPTWSFAHAEESSNFFEIAHTLLDAIADDFQILVKLHPYTYRLYPEKVAVYKERYKENDQILFVDEHPLVYPFLESADVFLGDYSSVAFDFLYFNRPLFFLGEKAPSWGKQIDDIRTLFDKICEEDTLHSLREAAYKHAFAPIEWSQVKHSLN